MEAAGSSEILTPVCKLNDATYEKTVIVTSDKLFYLKGYRILATAVSQKETNHSNESVREDFTGTITGVAFTCY
jgi:hypothetical protein